jgi:hypothetical protein
MNVKKMFAATAGMLIVASSLPVSVLGAASYSDELQGAYNYAYSKGITTMSSIDNANMYGELTRGQLAKMISNWAEKELGTKADETKVCSFADAQTAEGDLAAYVKKACQMGLMGQGITSFRPNDKVTRGEFGTTLSRAIWGTKYDGATPYYANHLQALKDKGIMTKIENPSQMEIRGYVMLMLERTSKTDATKAQCNDPVTVLACTMGATSCPAQCKDAKNQTGTVNTGAEARGDLTVSVADQATAVKTAPKGIFVANTIKFDASEKITLETLTLKRTGLSTRTDVEKIWLEKNGVAVTNAATLGSDGLAVLNFKNGRNTINGTENLELVVQLKSTADTGNEITFELTNATASARNISVKGTTTTYRIAGYKVVELLADKVNNNNSTYQLGQADYVIGQFALQSESAKDDRNVNVRSLTFRNNGSSDFGSMFKNVKVYRDSKVVSNKVEVNGRDITISLDKDVLKANKRALYTIRAEVANLDRVGETVQLKLANAKDIIADEDDTGFRTNVKFASTWTSGELATYTFSGGRVMLQTKAGFPRTIDAGIGANDVAIAEGQISVRENVSLPKIKIEYSTGSQVAGKWSTNDHVKGKDAIKRLVLEVDGSRFTADNDGNGNFVFDANTIVVRKNSTVRLLASLDSGVTQGKTIRMPASFGSSLMDGNGEYQSNSEPLRHGDIAGSINISTISVKDAKFQLIGKNLASVSTVVNDGTQKTVFEGKLSSKDKDVNVNSFKVELNTNLLDNSESIDVTLNVNGQPFSTQTLKNGSTSFDFNSIGTIKAGSEMPVSLTVIPNISRKQDITLKLKASGTDNNGNPTATSEEYSAKLEVKGTATIEVTNAVTADRVMEPAVNAILYEGNLNVTNGSTELTGFKFTEAKGAKLTVSNYKLYVDGDFVADSATPEFTGLTQNLEQGNRKVTVRANVVSAAGTTPVDFKYEANAITVNGVNSTKKANTYFAKGFFLLAKKSESNGVVTLTLTNNSPKTVDVKKLEFDAIADVASASVNGQSVDATDGTVAVQSVPANAAIEIQFVAKKDKTVKLEGVQYNVTDGADNYTYELTKDNASVGAWGNFFSSK